MTKVIGGRRHVHLPGYGPEREDLTIGLAARSGPDGQAGGKVEPRMTIRWPGAGCNWLPPRALTPFFLAPPSFRPLAWWRLVPRPEVVVSLASSARSSLPMRLTATGVIGYCLIFPLGQLGLITANTAGLRQAGWALAATVAYAPLYIRHVLYFVEGRAAAAGLDAGGHGRYHRRGRAAGRKRVAAELLRPHRLPAHHGALAVVPAWRGSPGRGAGAPGPGADHSRRPGGGLLLPGDAAVADGRGLRAGLARGRSGSSTKPGGSWPRTRCCASGCSSTTGCG